MDVPITVEHGCCSTPIYLVMGILTLIIILILSSKKDGISVVQTVNEKPQEKGPPPPNYYKTVVIIIIIVTAVFYLYCRSVEKMEFIKCLCKIFCKPVPEPGAFIYDTKPEYDRYIKDDLSIEQLKRFDKILMLEKKKCGLKLTKSDLDKLAYSAPELRAAYERWRWCVDLRRTSSHVVYPDERKFVPESERPATGSDP